MPQARRAGRIDAGNIGMPHQRQRLPLDFKPGQFLAGEPRRAYNLQRDVAPDSRNLLRQVNGSHTALADEFANLETVNDLSNTRGSLPCLIRSLADQRVVVSAGLGFDMVAVLTQR